MSAAKSRLAPAWRSAVVLCAVCGTTQADTLRVPAEHATIGAAIRMAQPGDTVLVADGTYTGPDNRGLDFEGKAITVRSEFGPEGCVIDCQGEDRAFLFHSGESRAAVVEGFRITKGRAANGGGIECTLESSPTIRDCVFLDNFAEACGGGVAARGNSHPLIERCVFLDNIAQSPELQAQGGGLCFFVLGDATVIDCAFIGNQAEYGGAMAVDVSFPTIINCLVADNFAEITGGGIVCSASDPLIINTTFTGNIAQRGGAVDLSGLVLDSFPELINCIAWDDSPEEFGGIRGEVTATWSNIQGGWPGSGNIDANPRFADRGAGDYRLAPDSPCIDAGDRTAVPRGIFTDLAGLARIVDDPATPDTGIAASGGVVDLGAYEVQVDACYADCDGNGTLTFFDFLCFQNLFAAGDPGADCDGDGSLTFFDFLCFQNAFAAGCP